MHAASKRRGEDDTAAGKAMRPTRALDGKHSPLEQGALARCEFPAERRVSLGGNAVADEIQREPSEQATAGQAAEERLDQVCKHLGWVAWFQKPLCQLLLGVERCLCVRSEAEYTLRGKPAALDERDPLWQREGTEGEPSRSIQIALCMPFRVHPSAVLTSMATTVGTSQP